MWDSFFYYVGVYSFIVFWFYQLYSPTMIFFSYLKDILLPWTKKTLIQKYGNWAVVTGSTDGMGKEYAKELAKRGFNIVLMARNEEKLKNVKKEIESEFKVEIKYIIVDFNQGNEIYERIAKELADIPVGVLVNNVGISGDNLGTFEKHSAKIVWDIVKVNCISGLMLTKIILPGMKKRGRGAIVNVSSICVLVPIINHACIYSCSKAFLSHFTKILQWELINYKNIDIQLLEPSFVNTKMLDFSKDLQNHFSAIDAKTWAKSNIKLLGRTRHTNGHWKHGLTSIFTAIFPEQIRVFVVDWYTKMLNI